MILPFLVNQHHFVCVLLNNFHLHKALFNPITRLRLWTENFLLHSFVTPINTLFNMPALTRCPCFLSTAIYHSGVSVLFFLMFYLSVLLVHCHVDGLKSPQRRVQNWNKDGGIKKQKKEKNTTNSSFVLYGTFTIKLGWEDIRPDKPTVKCFEEGPHRKAAHMLWNATQRVLFYTHTSRQQCYVPFKLAWLSVAS